MDYELILSAAGLFSHINDMSRYVSKERFDLAAKTVYDLEDPKRLDILYGLFNNACQSLHLFTNEKLRGDLSLAVNIAETAYVSNAIYKECPSPKGYYEKDIRRYFYTLEGESGIKEIDIDFRDPQNIVMLARLIEREDAELVGVATCLGSLKSRRHDKEYPYFDGDVVFLYGDPVDRVFYDWYRTDAGVYLATGEGWRKLKYVRGRGYLDKDGEEPEFENNNKYTDYKLDDSGLGFRFIGNINKDINVLADKEEGEEENA